MRLMRWTFSIVLIFLAQNLPGQFQNVYFTHLSVEDGLSQATVLAIAQDDNSFLWLGTADGLNRYDGYDFEGFRFDPKDDSSLIDNEIIALTKDFEGNIWVGTGRGLNTFDYDSEKFIRYPSDSGERSLSNDYIMVLYTDSQGRIWIGTKHGLNRYDAERDHFQKYFQQDFAKPSAESQTVHAITETANGDLWIGFSNGLCVIPAGDSVLQPYSDILGKHLGIESQVVTSLQEDKEGRLLVGTENGLRRIDLQKKSVELIPGTGGAIIKSLRYSYNGVLWIGTAEGIALLHEDMEQVDWNRHTGGVTSSLSNNDVLALWEDEVGTMWVGTGSGLNKYDSYLSQFHTVRLLPANPNDLASNKIWAILKEPKGVIWLGTERGLFALDGQKRERFIMEASPLTHAGGFISNSFSAMSMDNAGKLWLGTFGSGLVKFDPVTKTFQKFPVDPDDPHSSMSEVVRSVTPGPENTLWVGTTKGLNRFDIATGTFRSQLFNSPNGKDLKANSILYVYQDSRNMLWVGTEGGLVCFDYAQNSFEIFKHIPGDPSSLCHDFVRTIYETADSTVWVGTSGGLNRMNAETKTFQHYTVQEGLPNNVIYSIEEDNKGNLWLSTNMGLAKFDPDKLVFENYEARDGLQSNEFNTHASFKDEEGVLYFGGIKGFNYFLPSEIRPNPHPPKVIIKQVDLINRDSNALRRINLLPSEEIELSYKDYVMTFSFTAMNFTNSGKNSYQYMLEGFDKNWNDAGNKRTATYTNVPGGKYTFWVKASNNNGIWNHSGDSLKVVIRPPFWKELWFIILSILLVAGLTLLYVRYRVAKVRHRNIELESIVEDRTQTLNKQKIALEHSEAMFRSFYEDSPVGIAFEADGEFITKCNKKFEHIIGYREEEILGKGLKELTHPDDLEEDFASFNRAFANAAVMAYHREKRLIHKQGHIVYVNIAISFNRDDTGAVRSIILMLSDQTEEKLAEAQLERTKAQLLQSDKMASLGQLTAGIAHEINNPVNFIYSGINGLEKNLEALMRVVNLYEAIQNPKAFENDYPTIERLKAQINFQEVIDDIEGLMEGIKEGAERTDEIVRGLRLFSRREEGSYSLADVHNVLETALKLLNYSFKSHIELIKAFDPEIPEIECFPGQLSQVFMNIILNAIQAMGEEPGTLRIVTHNQKHKLKIQISDTGPGIPRAIQFKIFEPFFTTKEVGDGTGLGLSISYGIIERHQGKIKVKSKEGEGTTFIITLPKKLDLSLLHKDTEKVGN